MAYFPVDYKQIGLFVQMIRYADDDDVLRKEQHRLDCQRRLIVQEVLPPAIRDEFGQHNGDDIVVIALFSPTKILADRADQRAIWRRVVLELDAAAPLGPFFFHFGSTAGV